MVSAQNEELEMLKKMGIPVVDELRKGQYFQKILS
jgi:hypothetical protein